MTAQPHRLQRRRERGFRLPPGTVCCTRPGRWGNPFPTRGDWITWAAIAIGFRADGPGRAAASVAFYRHWLTGIVSHGPHMHSKAGDAICYGDGLALDTHDAARGIACFAADIFGRDFSPPPPPPLGDVRKHLAGRNLACFCRLCPEHREGKPFGVTCAACAPCHVDVLGCLANGISTASEVATDG